MTYEEDQVEVKTEEHQISATTTLDCEWENPLEDCEDATFVGDSLLDQE
jgi:hypothetical protein